MNKLLKLSFALLFVIGAVPVIYLLPNNSSIGFSGVIISLTLLTISSLLCTFFMWATLIAVLIAIIHFFIGTWFVVLLSIHLGFDFSIECVSILFFSWIYPLLIILLVVIALRKRNTAKT